MTVRPPAEIGMPLEEVETPALLVDLDVFEANLKRMANDAAAKGIKLRPHSKTHKSPVIALRQMALGAVGVCCQKVGEAEAMVLGGVPDVFISNEVVGRNKVARLAALARQARVAVCADDPAHVAALSEAAQSFSVELAVFVEVDVGAGRCGVAPGQPALDLARQVAAATSLRFAGLQAYHGSAQHKRTIAERREMIQSAAAKVRECTDLLAAAGIACELVSGAGTGTYPLEIASGAWQELQAGSYIFMDADYARNLDEAGQPISDFEQSLFVYATVMSRPRPEMAIVDAGLKCFSVDSGLPVVADLPGVEYVGAADEHGKLAIADTAGGPRIGDKVRLIPGHCDPTVNLYDWFTGVRNGRVETLWPIAARGAVY